MEKKKEIYKKINKNYGLQILRMILCFWIIIFHCCKIINPSLRKFIYSLFHVPTFIVISFYFFFNNLYNRNIAKIKQRFIRLLIPYIIWPIILLIMNNLSIKFEIKGKYEKNLTFKNLIYQFILAVSIHPILWFHFDLIFLTLFFTIISFIFKSYFLLILQVIAIYSYILQYSNIIYNYFKDFNSLALCKKASTIEVLPFAVTGLSLKYYNFIPRNKQQKYKIILFNVLIIYIIINYNIINKSNGFRYPGLNLNIGAFCFFSIFSLIPFENLNNKQIITLIEIITNYTGGIYYLHLIIKDYLIDKILIIKEQTYLGGILIYFLSYLICLNGSIIFKKSLLKNLFY